MDGQLHFFRHSDSHTVSQATLRTMLDIDLYSSCFSCTTVAIQTGSSISNYAARGAEGAHQQRENN